MPVVTVWMATVMARWMKGARPVPKEGADPARMTVERANRPVKRDDGLDVPSLHPMPPESVPV
jgi:hypothetical protein